MAGPLTATSTLILSRSDVMERLSRHDCSDVPAHVIGAPALVAAWRFRVPEPGLIAVGAAVGLIIFAL
jgi:hypothetical protein